MATTTEPLPEGGTRQVHIAKARSLINVEHISAILDDPRMGFSEDDCDEKASDR